MVNPVLLALWYLSKLVSAVAGLWFLYMAFFVYPDESGKIHNRLVDLWVRANTKQEELLSKQAALIKASANIATMGLNWLFGKKLVSMQSVVVSFCMSMASFGALLWFHRYLYQLDGGTGFLIIGGVAFLVWGLFAARVLFPKRLVFIGLIGLLILIALFGGYFGFSSPHKPPPGIPLFFLELGLIVMFVCVALFGLACDLMLLVVSRLMIRSMAETTKEMNLAFAVSFSFVWSLLLLQGTRIFFIINNKSYYIRLFNYCGNQIFGVVVFCGLGTNLFNLIASSSVFLVVLVVLLHRIFWPPASRIIFAL